jgi:hypothetical protein
MAGMPEPTNSQEMLTGIFEVASKLKAMYDNAIKDRMAT